MKIIIHAGHNPDGKIACGAVGFMKESTCNRDVLSYINSKHLTGVTCFSIEDGTSQIDVLKKQVARIEADTYDLSISIHFNAAGDKKAAGVEAYAWDVYSENIGTRFAKNFLAILEKKGYKNRGLKSGKTLYVIKNTSCPSILLECGFITNQDDCRRYSPSLIGDAIITAIQSIQGNIIPDSKVTEDGSYSYRVIAGTFNNRDNAEKQLNIVKEDVPDAYIERKDV